MVPRAPVKHHTRSSAPSQELSDKVLDDRGNEPAPSTSEAVQ